MQVAAIAFGLPATTPQAGTTTRGADVGAVVPVEPLDSRSASTSVLQAVAGGDRTRFVFDAQTPARLVANDRSAVYLAQLSGALANCKLSLARVAAGQDSRAQAASDIATARALWHGRAAMTQSMLDARLKVKDRAGAAEKFTVRGLQAATLENGGKETLSFSWGINGTVSQATIDPSQPASTQIRGLCAAFTNLGIAATVEEGELVLNVPPSLQDKLSALMVRGGGHRYPAGQFVPLRLGAAAQAIDPDPWDARDATQTRASLERVLDACDKVETARHYVEAQASALAEQIAPDWGQTERVAAFAQQFARNASKEGYGQVAGLMAAVAGFDRERVRSLLEAQATQQ
jgi:hypothetical protein